MFRNPAEKEGFQDVQIPCREEGVKMFRYPAGKEECQDLQIPCREGGVSICLETLQGRCLETFRLQGWRGVKMFGNQARKEECQDVLETLQGRGNTKMFRSSAENGECQDVHRYPAAREGGIPRCSQTLQELKNSPLKSSETMEGRVNNN